MDDRPVVLDYVFDRLGEAHLAQAYRLLVPERRRLTRGDVGNADDSGDLRAGFFGATERGADHCQPDSGVRAHAAAAGLEVPPDWVFEDEGYSGATLIRPGLERLRDLAAEIEIPVVLCYAPDRLARRYAYQALLIEEFARVGSEVRFLKGPKAETPEDELLLQFQGMIAEYERAQIVERTRRGKLHRARSGSPAVLSGAPYGYRYVRKSEEAEARYDIVGTRGRGGSRAVSALRRRERVDCGTLTRWLGEQGIPTATGKSRWDRSTIWGMLRNPAYCGHAAFGKTRQVDARPKMTRPVRRQGKRVVSSGHVTRDQPRSEWIEISVPPIVSEQVFELATRRLQDNRRFAPRRTKEPSLLQGLVACASCGYSYYRTLDAHQQAKAVLLPMPRLRRLPLRARTRVLQPSRPTGLSRGTRMGPRRETLGGPRADPH